MLTRSLSLSDGLVGKQIQNVNSVKSVTGGGVGPVRTCRTSAQLSSHSGRLLPVCQAAAGVCVALHCTAGL